MPKKSIFGNWLTTRVPLALRNSLATILLLSYVLILFCAYIINATRHLCQALFPIFRYFPFKSYKNNALSHLNRIKTLHSNLYTRSSASPVLVLSIRKILRRKTFSFRLP